MSKSRPSWAASALKVSIQAICPAFFAFHRTPPPLRGPPPPTGEDLRSEAERSGGQAGGVGDDLPGGVDPVADPAAGVARVDHLFHLEAVERPDRAPGAFDAGVDLG